MTPPICSPRRRSPAPFEVPAPPAEEAYAERLAEDWVSAADLVDRELQARAEHRATGTATLNRLTLDLIRDGGSVPVGDRHRLLFSAAANLAEFGCPVAFAHALLTDAGLDSGLPPSEVRRQIECGLEHKEGGK